MAFETSCDELYQSALAETSPYPMIHSADSIFPELPNQKESCAGNTHILNGTANRGFQGNCKPLIHR